MTNILEDRFIEVRRSLQCRVDDCRPGRERVVRQTEVHITHARIVGQHVQTHLLFGRLASLK